MASGGNKSVTIDILHIDIAVRTGQKCEKNQFYYIINAFVPVEASFNLFQVPRFGIFMKVWASSVKVFPTTSTPTTFRMFISMICNAIGCRMCESQFLSSFICMQYWFTFACPWIYYWLLSKCNVCLCWCQYQLQGKYNKTSLGLHFRFHRLSSSNQSYTVL